MSCDTGLVIASYAAFRDLRTISRLLLVNLSVADLIVSMSHLVGLIEDIGKYVMASDRVYSIVDCFLLRGSKHVQSIYV